MIINPVVKSNVPRFFPYFTYLYFWQNPVPHIILSDSHVEFISKNEHLIVSKDDLVGVLYKEVFLSKTKAFLLSLIFAFINLFGERSLNTVLDMVVLLGLFVLMQLSFRVFSTNWVGIKYYDGADVKDVYFTIVWDVWGWLPRREYTLTKKLYKQIAKMPFSNNSERSKDYDLSTIIVSYNTKKLTLQSIKSVLKDTSVKKKEIIVIDNDSKDGSVEALEKLALKNKSITLIKNKENVGFSKANNQGIKIARGKYVLLLNSDTVVKKDALGILIQFAEDNENVGVVGARLLNADESIQDSCFNFPTVFRAIKQYWFNSSDVLDKFAPKTEKPVQVEAVVGAAMLLTQEALSTVGGLDERYFFFYEDLEYCRDVRRAGLKVYYHPNSEIIHYHGASGKKLAKDDTQWRRLIPSSKIYHGVLGHYIFNFVLWSGQKLDKFNLRKS